jgi:hypothetical protein
MSEAICGTSRGVARIPDFAPLIRATNYDYANLYDPARRAALKAALRAG